MILIEITFLVLVIIPLAPLVIVLGTYHALIIVAILAMVTVNALSWLDDILSGRHNCTPDAQTPKEIPDQPNNQ